MALKAVTHGASKATHHLARAEHHMKQAHHHLTVAHGAKKTEAKPAHRRASADKK